MSKPTPGGQLPTGIPVPRSKRGVKGFFAEVVREMKKVHWPTMQESNRLTGVVLAVCLLLTGILTAMHEGFQIVLSLLTKGTFPGQ
jgi:preprotein translocase SecE subunit